MARSARLVVPGIPHHVTQRGNRRQKTFFTISDYRIYIRMLSKWCHEAQLDIWAYCLMPNHVHMIVVPPDEASLSRGIGETNKAYSRLINARHGWQGYLFQGRFASFPMDDDHLIACARYIEQNPVAARIADRPEDYPWSSARAHVQGRNDRLVRVAPLLRLMPDWNFFLGSRETDTDVIEQHVRSGKPFGCPKFIRELELRFGRRLTSARRGRKPRISPSSEALDPSGPPARIVTDTG